MPVDHYELVSIWRLNAPMEQVWQILSDGQRWPEWWPFVEAVEQIDPGGPGGVRSVWRHTWRTMLPYKLRFALCVTRIEAPSLLEADVTGDVLGRGVCRISTEDGQTVVRYEWKVRTCRPWMKWLGPVARPLFGWNHRMVMQRGAAGLAAFLARCGDNRDADSGSGA